jgi:hypothetical protein
MNERIRELMIQSSMVSEVVGNPNGLWTTKMSVKTAEKFAELIVRECANHCDLLLDHKISSEWSRGTHDCSRAIKKHFGVE